MSADEPLSNRPKWPNYPYPITAQDAPAAVYALYIAVHHYERAMNQKDGPQDEQLTYKNLQEAMEAAAESTDICPILNHHGNDEIQKELRVRGIPQVYTAEMALRIEGWRAAGPAKEQDQEQELEHDEAGAAHLSTVTRDEAVPSAPAGAKSIGSDQEDSVEDRFQLRDTPIQLVKAVGLDLLLEIATESRIWHQTKSDPSGRYTPFRLDGVRLGLYSGYYLGLRLCVTFLDWFFDGKLTQLDEKAEKLGRKAWGTIKQAGCNAVKKGVSWLGLRHKQDIASEDLELGNRVLDRDNDHHSDTNHHPLDQHLSP